MSRTVAIGTHFGVCSQSRKLRRRRGASVRGKQGRKRTKEEQGRCLSAQGQAIRLRRCHSVLYLTPIRYYCADRVCHHCKYILSARYHHSVSGRDYNGTAEQHEENAREFAELSRKVELLLKIARQIKLKHLDKSYACFFLEKMARNVQDVVLTQDQDYAGLVASAKSCQTTIKKSLTQMMDTSAEDADDGYVFAVEWQHLRKIIDQLKEME